MLPELRTDLFGKNVNRKFYTVSLQKPERSTLCLSTVNGGCLSYCIDVRMRSRMHDMCDLKCFIERSFAYDSLS